MQRMSRFDFDQEYLSPARVAEVLDVTRRTVYTWISEGRLQATKSGPKLWRVSRSQLRAFLGQPEPVVTQALTASARSCRGPEKPLQAALPVLAGFSALAAVETALKQAGTKQPLAQVQFLAGASGAAKPKGKKRRR